LGRQTQTVGVGRPVRRGVALRVGGYQEPPGDLEQGACLREVRIACQRSIEQRAARRRLAVLELDAREPQQRSRLRRLEREQSLERGPGLAGLAQDYVARGR